MAWLSALASVGCVALSTGTSAIAHAEGSRAAVNAGQLFGVHPVQQGRTTLPGGHFNFALVAGQRITDGIVIENFSDHTLNFRVYGADLLTAIGGGLAPAQQTARMRDVGAWFIVTAPTITVAAHGQLTDAFTLTVPAVVSPGQHLGALVASADAGTTPQGNPIEERVALITVVTVPGVAHASGALTQLSVSTADSGQLRFGIALSNTGNVLLTYAASLEITGDGGRRVATIALLPAGAYVVPGGRVPLAALWKEAGVGPGHYRGQATIVMLDNSKPVGTLFSQVVDLKVAGAFPTLAVVASVLAIGIIVVFATWCIRRRRRHGRIFARERAFPSPRRGLGGVR